MNTCFYAKDVVPVELLHEDKTVRVQTITPEHYLYPLLDDIPFLVNTSLNINGKPICNDEQDVSDLVKITNLTVL